MEFDNKRLFGITFCCEGLSIYLFFFLSKVKIIIVSFFTGVYFFRILVGYYFFLCVSF